MFNDEKEIIESIKREAQKYVPEWSFDEENPDMAAAFAMSFAKMLAESARLYDEVWDKQYIAFLNAIGQEPLPEEQAEGIVVFSLSEGARQGCFVPEATVLLDERGQSSYAVQSRIYVTPAVIKTILCTWGQQDIAYLAWEAESEEPISLFSYNDKENMQKHQVFIADEAAFFLNSSAEIAIRDQSGASSLALLARQEVISLWYFAGEWIPFAKVEHRDGVVYLKQQEGRPFEKTAIEGRQSFFLRMDAKDAKAAEKLALDQVSLLVFAKEIPTEKIYHGDVELLARGAYPFGKTLIPFDTFYIACAEVFVKSGAEVVMTLEAACHSFDMTDGLLRKDIEWKHVLDKNVFKEPEKVLIEINEIAIEYWNGKDFVKLDTKENQMDICKVGQESETKTMRFRCPTDMERATFNGRTSLWIRIRIVEITNLHKGLGVHTVPYWKNIRFSYEYEKAHWKPSALICKNNGQTHVFERSPIPENVFEAFEEEEPAIFFGLSQPPEKSPISLLVSPAFTADFYPDDLTYFYFTGSRWEELQTKDETENFRRTGLLTFSAQGQWKKACIFGYTHYWLKIKRKTGYKNDPRSLLIKSFTLNGAKVKSEKAGGNTPENTVISMPMSIGYINKVTNPFPITGGRPAELPTEMIKRGTSRLRHRGRAVSAFDMESLAHEALRDLIKCKCFEHTNAKAERETGVMTLVILSSKQEGEDPMINATDKIKNAICKNASPVLSKPGALFVIEAIKVEIVVRAEIYLYEKTGILQAENEIAKSLEDFFNPVTGNFQNVGYEIGEIPDESKVRHFLFSLENQGRIESLYMTGFAREKEKRIEVDLSKIAKRKFAIPVSGKHEITCR